MKKILLISLLTVSLLLFWVGAFFFYDFKFGAAGVVVNGYSMNPTMGNGQHYNLSTTRKPVIGDVISFQCLSEKCRNGEDLKNLHLLKRLLKQNGNCIWVEGDNTEENSYDSRWYGWLCSGEYKLEGVVIF